VMVVTWEHISEPTNAASIGIRDFSHHCVITHMHNSYFLPMYGAANKEIKLRVAKGRAQMGEI
jgi:hypothetical protein